MKSFKEHVEEQGIFVPGMGRSKPAGRGLIRRSKSNTLTSKEILKRIKKMKTSSLNQVVSLFKKTYKPKEKHTYKDLLYTLPMSVKKKDIQRLFMKNEKLKRAYGAGLSKSTNAKRQAQFNKQKKMRDDDPNAYKPAPGDKRAKTKPSKHTKKFKAMFGEGKADKALANKAKKTGMPKGILRQVYNRGVAAWKTGHRPGTNPHQWGLARVNSFATKSKGTWGKADKDLAAKVRKSKKKKKSVKEYKVPSNYAAMMAKKRKKAGTSEFGSKKKKIKKS